MNKNDIILIFIITIITASIFTYFKLNEKTESLKAQVFYESKNILEIDLNSATKQYTVDGYNGPVNIVAGEGKIKVLQEDSPLHLCSKQGYISKSYETIVCLPNKIVIKLESESEVDSIAR